MRKDFSSLLNNTSSSKLYSLRESQTIPIAKLRTINRAIGDAFINDIFGYIVENGKLYITKENKKTENTKINGLRIILFIFYL
jgi:hypothetical protein